MKPFLNLDPSWSFLIIFMPLFGSIVWALFGKSLMKLGGDKDGKRVVAWGATGLVLAGFVVALDFALQLNASGKPFDTITIFQWISLQSVNIPFELRLDSLSLTMTLVVTGIGGMIHWYAAGYMWEEREYSRFFTYLNLFIAFMLLLVLGNNLAMLFIGWEGVGVCSYLLIGFWYKDQANAKAANKAFIANRVGDFGLTLGLFYLVYLIGGQAASLGIESTRWLSYDVMFQANVLEGLAHFPKEIMIVSLLLFVGAMGKSAQFPLYVWLPDAMAGPTPVSALIHAATMVTSGVVLLNRMAPIFLMSPVTMSVVAGVGAITALLGALIAFGQTDIKKVLAFSTVSQLGYMFIACGVGVFSAGIFHVVTHAFFKALLFLTAGSVIYAMAHNQDMRNYGGLFKKIPITAILMTIGFLALIGTPFLFAGFWSKEAILGPAVNDVSYTLLITNIGDYPLTVGALAGWIGFLAAFCTAFYMTRQMALTFMGKSRWTNIEPAHHAHHHAAEILPMPAHDEHAFFMSDAEVEAFTVPEPEHHDLDKTHEPKEVPASMWLPLSILAFFSLGPIWWIAEKNHFVEEWLTGGHSVHDWAVDHNKLIIISFLVFIGGVAAGLMVYRKGLPEKEGWDMAKWNPVRRSALNQFSIDALASDGTSTLGNHLGKVLTWIDVNIVDGLVNLVGVIAKAIGSLLKAPQNKGLVRHYAILMHLGAAAMIVLAAWKLGVFN